MRALPEPAVRRGRHIGLFAVFACMGLFWPGTVLRAQSQPKTVEVVYDFFLDLGLARRYQSRLFIDGERSLFLWGKALSFRKEEAMHEFHLALGASDSIGSYTYTDRVAGRMISRIPLQGNKRYQVCEPLPRISWRFDGDTRQIGPYTCERATGDFRGRRYEVWFAPAVPILAGPWKLQGLPGLVVEARDRSGEIVFRLNTLKPAGRILKEIRPGEDCLDISEFASLQKAWAGEMLRRMNAKLPRGARLSLGSQNAMESFE